MDPEEKEMSPTYLQLGIKQSYYEQCMRSTALTRIYYIVLWLQFILGSAVIAQINSSFVNICIGFTVAGTAALSFIYDFKRNAYISFKAFKQYSKLEHEYESNQPITRKMFDQIDAKYSELELTSPIVTGSIKKIASKAVFMFYNMPENEQIKLNWFEMLIAFFSGEKLVFIKSNERKLK